MIELSDASRWYGSVIGINGVSCAIRPGVTALLGPNGAGKSTMLKLVTGQILPTTGSVTMFGERPFANPRVLRRLGYCPESESLYEERTGREFLLLMGALSGIARGRLPGRVDEVLETVGMTEAAGRRAGGYSKGMRQRIKIGQCLLHDPEVLVLDEPLNGLDPVSRHEMSSLFRALGEEGKTVLVSSHILFEVEQMTRTILLIHRGRLLAQGDIHHIRSLIDAHPHRISFRTDRARDLARRLLEMPFVLSARIDDGSGARSPDGNGNRSPARIDEGNGEEISNGTGDPGEWLEIETRDPEAFYAGLPAVVLDGGFAVRSFHSPDNNLEAVFSYLIKG